MSVSVSNIETRIGINGTSHIMEVLPRGGGNRLVEMLRHLIQILLLLLFVPL